MSTKLEGTSKDFGLTNFEWSVKVYDRIKLKMKLSDQ